MNNLLLFAALVGGKSVAASKLVVDTTGGAVAGECVGGSSNSGHCRWSNIPFALPPTPEYNGRFQPPQPLSTKWDGVRDGTSIDGNACLQTPYDSSTPQSEDCLHLTVWTPPDSHANAPVIVFFYGGGALTGANNWCVHSCLPLPNTLNIYISLAISQRCVAPACSIGPMHILI